MQSVTITGPNLPRGAKATFHVHAEGCGDIARDPITRNGDNWTMEAETIEHVVDEVYPPEDFDCEPGEFVDEFYFAPCVTLAHRSEQSIPDGYVRRGDGDLLEIREPTAEQLETFRQFGGSR